MVLMGRSSRLGVLRPTSGKSMAQVVLPSILDAQPNGSADEFAFSEQPEDGPLSEDAGFVHYRTSHCRYLRRSCGDNLPAQSNPSETIWTNQGPAFTGTSTSTICPHILAKPKEFTHSSNPSILTFTFFRDELRTSVILDVGEDENLNPWDQCEHETKE